MHLTIWKLCFIFSCTFWLYFLMHTFPFGLLYYSPCVLTKYIVLPFPMDIVLSLSKQTSSPVNLSEKYSGHLIDCLRRALVGRSRVCLGEPVAVSRHQSPHQTTSRQRQNDWRSYVTVCAVHSIGVDR